MAQTEFEYYEDESSWGSGQYMALKEIIDAVVLSSMDDDSYLKNTKRSQILMHAKNGLKKLTAESASDVLSFEITVPEDLVVVMPQDYVNWVEVFISKLDISTGTYRLHLLNKNGNINIADGYLQDDLGDILFDDNGKILKADATNAFGMAYKKYSYSDQGAQFKLDTSRLSEHGEFNIDERTGRFVFSSDLSEKEVVIRYISNGLQALTFNEDEITLHVYLEEALKSYIYYNLISGRRTVPANEKYRAKQELKSEKHKASLKLMEFDLTEVSRLMRRKSMIL